ncbi:MAG: pentapeptide repeat-containing protein [Chloroflexota bacterium]
MFPQASERSDPPPGEGTRDGATAPASDHASDRVVAFGRATLRGVDFRRARFDKFSLAGCLFVSCDFRAIRMDKRYQPLFAATPRSIFRDCRFDGADLRRIRPAQTRFERCTFDDADLDGWRSEAAEFLGCRFAGALGAVTFFGRPMGASGRGAEGARKNNAFTDNDFRDADLDRVVFAHGVDLVAQRLPASDRYVRLDRFPQRLARARTAIVRWDVQEERVAALAMLRALATRYPGQAAIIASRVSGTGPAARVQTRVWAVLERAVG